MVDGEYDAFPLRLHLNEDGVLTAFLEGKKVFSGSVRVSADPDVVNDPNGLLSLPGATKAPASTVYSWLNEAGKGQIVIVGDEVLVCPIRRRLPSQKASEKPKHPMAGFWLSITASMLPVVTIRGLEELSGYSYPTCLAWVKTQSELGTLDEQAPDGREQQFQATGNGLRSWWEDLRKWWPQWRGDKWPKRHGRPVVHYVRAKRKLPLRELGEPLSAIQKWCPDIWATGADHLRRHGSLVQNQDCDAWCGESSWEQLGELVQEFEPPRGDPEWNGQRISVMVDDHPLIRLLRHGAGDRGLRKLSQGLLEGLPLIDAAEYSDARVRQVALESINRFEKHLDQEAP